MVSPKQSLFVAHYLKDLNATAAYIRAGYSPKGADGHAARLVGKGSIQAAIKEGMAKRLEKIDITSAWVLNGIATIAKNAEKDADRLHAFELLGKHLGIFQPQELDPVEKILAKLPPNYAIAVRTELAVIVSNGGHQTGHSGPGATSPADAAIPVGAPIPPIENSDRPATADTSEPIAPVAMPGA